MNTPSRMIFDGTSWFDPEVDHEKYILLLQKQVEQLAITVEATRVSNAIAKLGLKKLLGQRVIELDISSLGLIDAKRIKMFLGEDGEVDITDIQESV